MPSIPLYVTAKPFSQRVGEAEELVGYPEGRLPLDPVLTDPAMDCLVNRKLECVVRCPPAPGMVFATLDTGAPFSIFPQIAWDVRFRWKEGVHYEVCEIAKVGRYLGGQLLKHSYRCRVVRLKVPVEIAGTSSRPDHRFRIENMVAQLVEGHQQKMTVLGLWGGAFEGTSLSVSTRDDDGEITASLDC